MVSAGEASGDMHCAAALRSLDRTKLAIFGMGGKHLAASNVELVVNIDLDPVMGFVEVLQKLPRLYRQLWQMQAELKRRKPDILLLVDYPGFNMKLARTANQLGIPVVYFIAPKVWASRAGRLRELQHTIDLMAVILPFEQNLYRDAGIPVEYVGNPVLDNGPLRRAANAALCTEVVPADAPRVALLPGSRRSEVAQCLPTMLDCARALSQRHPGIRFCLPIAETIDPALIEQHIGDSGLTIRLLEAGDYPAVASCHAAIVASGTATLELAVLGVPMAIVYRMHPLSFAIARRIILIEHVGLVNIVAAEPVATELLQSAMTADAIVTEIDRLLFESAYRGTRRRQLRAVRDALGTAGAADNLAALLQRALTGEMPAIAKGSSLGA